MKIKSDKAMEKSDDLFIGLESLVLEEFHNLIDKVPFPADLDQVEQDFLQL